MKIEFCAEFLESVVEGVEFTECSFGSKSCDFGHWTELYYSQATGWSQILYWSESPQKEHDIVKIVYYDSALSALRDNSIFPAGSRVWFN